MQPNQIKKKRKTKLGYAQPSRPMKSVLAFTPEAWIKLQYLCHIGDTEVGGFAVMTDTSEMLVTEFVLIKQRCTPISVKFEDESIAQHFDDMVDRDLNPGGNPMLVSGDYQILGTRLMIDF